MAKSKVTYANHDMSMADAKMKKAMKKKKPMMKESDEKEKKGC